MHNEVQDEKVEKQSLVEWLATQGSASLQQDITSLGPDEASRLSSAQLLKAACDWVALEFKKRVGHFPRKVDLHTVMAASISVVHSYLLPSLKSGPGLLYTFGYTMPCADATIEQLVKLGILVVDIRYSANSRAAKWRKAQLQERLGTNYVHLSQLGNVNYNRPGGIQLSQPEIGVPFVAELLLQGQHIALMCMCSDVDGCHREVAAEHILERFPSLHIIHL